MSLPVFIRTAAKGDLEVVQRLLATTWHDTYDEIYGKEMVSEITAEWHSMIALRDRMNIPHSEFIVADNGETILGMAFASVVTNNSDEVEENTKPEAAKPSVQLHQLYVAPAAQNRGIGQQLWDEILFCFEEFDRFIVEVEPANIGAVKFYQRNGFKETGTLEDCGGMNSNIEAIVMTLDITMHN